MAYQPTIPLATDRLSQSQGDIQGNFVAISSWVNTDHVDFNTVNAGQHKFVTMPQQTADPAVTGTATDLRIYNKAYNAGVNPSNRNEIYLQRMTGSPAIPITATLNSATGVNGVGYTYLPSGLVIKYGNGACDSDGVATINTAGIGPNFNAFLNVQLTVLNGVGTPGILSVSAISSSQFQVNSTAANTGFVWTAIGIATTP